MRLTCVFYLFIYYYFLFVRRDDGPWGKEADFIWKKKRKKQLAALFFFFFRVLRVHYFLFIFQLARYIII